VILNNVNLHIWIERKPSQDTIHASYTSSNAQTILKEIFPPVRKHPVKSKLVGIGNLLTGDEVRYIRWESYGAYMSTL
jgi:hypothetical protein